VFPGALIYTRKIYHEGHEALEEKQLTTKDTKYTKRKNQPFMYHPYMLLAGIHTQDRFLPEQYAG